MDANLPDYVRAEAVAYLISVEGVLSSTCSFGSLEQALELGTDGCDRLLKEHIQYLQDLHGVYDRRVMTPDEEKEHLTSLD